MMRTLLLLLAVSALPLLSAAQQPPQQPPPDLAAIPPHQPAANDASQYRRLVLPNGIKVILLSDPKLNVSSASLAVQVGSFSDPPRRPGLAHFLEHMLFLGTEKYPDITDFSGYLGRNGGYNNAYTAGDRTNYHFEIRHEAFEGALDRFAQFFIAPTFDPRFTEREMNAVNSEHQKNLESDLWREDALSRTVYERGHPAAKFSTGNRETLTGTTREELLAFYRSHYSANRMTLALTGRASLEQLEAWARAAFNAVPNRNIAAPRFPSQYLARKPALRTLRMEPLKDLRHLKIEFPLPPQQQNWPNKAPELLGFALGSEGPGSLLAQLKSEGLASGLQAGVQMASADFASFDMQINLTPAGLEKVPRVLDLLFVAIDQLRAQGLPPHLFGERQTLARLDELYRDKGEGAARALALANALMDYPIEIAERVPFLWLKDDPAAFQALIANLRPDNMLTTLVAKGQRTDKIEPIYGTAYSYSESAGPAYTALTSPPLVATIQPPRPNPFVPARTSLLALQPVKLIEEPTLQLYYAQDTEFQRPMAAHLVRFRPPRAMATLRNSVLLRFYELCVREALNEVTYTAAEAGQRFSFNATLDSGVLMVVDGYDDGAGRLLDAVVPSLIDFKLTNERFAALKDQLLRELSAFERGDAYQIVAETRRATVREFHFRPDEQLPLAREVTHAQVREFARALYERGRIEALSYGNIDVADAVGAARRVSSALKPAAVPESDLLRRRLLVSDAGEALRTSEQLQVNNSAFRREYVLGGDTPELRAATLVLAAFVGDPFYTEMRTQQQLGYIVFGSAAEDERTPFGFFIIQSGEYAADVLEARADAFINGLPAQLAALPDDAWKALVGGARAKLEEKDKSIAERAQRLFVLAYERNADWLRRENTLAALDKLTRERTIELLNTALSPQTGKPRTFLGFARGQTPAAQPAVTFANRDVWKRGRVFE